MGGIGPEVAVFGGLGLFTALLIAGLLAWNRREKRRVAEALKALVIRTSLAGPPLNARVIAWAAPTLLLSLGAGVLTANGGPVSQSNVAFAILMGVVMVVGAIGAATSAMRRIGVAELDRGAKVLRVSLAGGDRVFRLDAPFEYRAFSLPPKQLYPTGGTGLVVSQNGVTASFWFLNERRDLKGERPPLRDRPPEELRSKDGIGREIYEHVRNIAAGAR